MAEQTHRSGVAFFQLVLLRSAAAVVPGRLASMLEVRWFFDHGSWSSSAFAEGADKGAGATATGDLRWEQAREIEALLRWLGFPDGTPRVATSGDPEYDYPVTIDWLVRVGLDTRGMPLPFSCVTLVSPADDEGPDDDKVRSFFTALDQICALPDEAMSAGLPWLAPAEGWLRFCSACGAAATPHVPRTATYDDSRQRAWPGGHDSFYWCAGCADVLLAPNPDDTGAPCACGRSVPAYSTHCGFCGKAY